MLGTGLLQQSKLGGCAPRGNCLFAFGIHEEPPSIARTQHGCGVSQPIRVYKISFYNSLTKTP